MAILPIDLQTMYASLDKVSKLTSQKQQVDQLQSAMHQEEMTKKLQDQAKAVEKSKMDDSAGIHIKEKNEHSGSQQNSQEHKEKEESPKKQVFESIKDPSLGQRIDISG